jgi:hypothetical protein
MIWTRDRWPPPQPIHGWARTSAFTVAACLAAAGVATVVLAWNELTCTAAIYEGPARTAPPSVCEVLAGIGGVTTLLGLVAIAGSIAIVVNVRQREVSDQGADGWRWGLAVVFTIGLLVLVTRLPSQTCPGGARLDGLFRICIDEEAGTRFDSTSWIWAKSLLAIAAPVIGFALIPRRRLGGIAVVITVAVWSVAIGWLLLDTIGRDVIA